MGKNTIPDRWEDYSTIGSIVPGTRFVAFKVPLKPSLLSAVPEGVDNKWGLADLMNSCPDLGLVLDLTFTYRYYNGGELASLGVEYKKIMTAGHEIPSSKVIADFYSTVDAFLAKDDSRTIGVHCTHGLNRTGYLICRYMVERLGFEPDEAISAFDSARGHKQERQNYLNHIRTKGWEKKVAASSSSSGPDKSVSALDYSRARGQERGNREEKGEGTPSCRAELHKAAKHGVDRPPSAATTTFGAVNAHCHLDRRYEDRRHLDRRYEDRHLDRRYEDRHLDRRHEKDEAPEAQNWPFFGRGGAGRHYHHPYASPQQQYNQGGPARGGYDGPGHRSYGESAHDKGYGGGPNRGFQGGPARAGSGGFGRGGW